MSETDVNECAGCTRPNSYQDMVECDSCTKWYHYDCAKVDVATVADKSFQCSDCAELNKTVRDEEDVAGTKSNKDTSQRVLRDVGDVALSTNRSIAASSARSRRRLELELKRLEEQKELELRFQREREEKEKEFLSKRYELLTQDEEVGSVSTYARSRTSDWVKKVGAHAVKNPNADSITRLRAPPEDLVARVADICLSDRNIAARQVMPKELPVFSGRPEDWPMFIGTFESSSKLCGFTDSENMWRLQRALKGQALESVRSILVIPSMVPKIITILQTQFGPPGPLIKMLTEKIRSEPPPKADRLETLVSFANSVRNLCGTMEACSLQNHVNNPVLLDDLIDKLPAAYKMDWAKHRASSDLNLLDFSEWLDNISNAASSVTNYIDVKIDKRQSGIHTHAESHTITKAVNKVNGCFMCNGTHRLLECSRFKDLSIKKRRDLVNKKEVCEVCLSHQKRFRCRNRGQEKCHFLLQAKREDSHHVNLRPCNAHQQNEDRSAIFRIVPVVLYGNGKSLNTFAFLDSGSSLTLVEQKISEELGLNGVAKPLCLKWTAETVRYEQDSKVVPLEISGAGQFSERYRLQDVRTVQSLALPRQTVSVDVIQQRYPYLRGIPLPSFKNSSCGILIGLNNQKLTLSLKTKEGGWNDPVAIETRLGWCLSGGETTGMRSNGVYHIYKACECDAELDDMIRLQYTLEAENNEKSICETAEEVRSRKILEDTVCRIGSRFVSSLLWKQDDVVLPDSYAMVLKRLQCLERKVHSDASLFESVNNQVQNLLDKNYARKLSKSELAEERSRVWYLPTFLVKNPNKPGKVRMVWDAAAKTHRVSLNDMLLKGPDELRALTNVLSGFRMNRIAVAGDIQEMFHQIEVCEADQHCQRFLWRNGLSSLEPDVYVMKVLTFGATCSPSIAQYVKNRNAMDFADEFPEAAEAIINRHYVDDYLDSVDTIEEAIQLVKKVKFIHSRGGFNIRKWLSNSEEVLRAIGEPEASQQEPTTILDNFSTNTCTMKVLGLWWDFKKDSFGFSLQFGKVQKDIILGLKIPTKRELLRVLMSIFDPLGFLSFYLVKLKVLMQEVWRTAIAWDDVIPEELQTKWESWRGLLKDVQEVQIPRCYYPKNFSKAAKIQLHIYVDASEDAMAAVAYLRFQEGHSIGCSLICAKNKVAPLKPLSIPRLELQAAVMGARLADSISKMLKMTIEKRFLWTDSRNVIHWLKSDAKRYKQFVMFRISDILQRTRIEEWRWTPTKFNVADEATKWAKVQSFDKDARWFRGPDFLYNPEETWPTIPTSAIKHQEELRPRYVLVTSSLAQSFLVDFERFSSYTRLKRTMAWVLRYINNFRRNARGESKYGKMLLSTEELQRAEQLLFRMAQNDSYGDEIVLLTAGKTLPKTSQLYKLSPYIDVNGVLRLRGRIDNARYADEDTRRPIIMSKDHYVTFLLVQFYHEKFQHQCQETVVNEVKQRFWIPKLRPLVRRVRKKCPECLQRQAKPVVPEMAPLPEARLAAYTRPFSYVGVDYFGPIIVKIGRRAEKRWGVLFTCLTVRAVHLEVAHSLSADSCIMCIRNFVSRRGVPKEIYSDNGTNLRGAQKEMREAFSGLEFDKIQEKFTTSETKWYFNPPAAPHMGGVWERLVGSVKHVLQQVMKNQRLTDESLLSMLIEVEMIVSTRPLTYVPVESHDMEALTPNHFLLGSSSGYKPAGRFCHRDLLLHKQWRRCQRVADLFWKRWVREYLPTLTRRTKWFQEVKNIEEGDVVIVIDENLPRGSWPKGIVTRTIKAKDGAIRKATVKTATGLYDRPVARLAVLDVSKIEDDGDSTA